MAWPEQYKSLWWRDSEASSREAQPVNLQLTTATSRRIPACSESQSRRHSQCRPQLKRMGLNQFGGYLKSLETLRLSTKVPKGNESPRSEPEFPGKPSA